ncbi:MAG: hypothetical protein DRH12_07035 [Deltaproteobacteria bacterium]|nr:MAG: hypothetical protein DRH12_07035 [Deltaproteobacteria bacterium]RLB74849.1 MAG: hypothetical protein DRH15_14995 [Deltaproteobacteria bacterium]
MTIEEKIAWAETQFVTSKAWFFSDTVLTGLLEKFRSARADCRFLMAEAGIIDICRRCEQEEGSCCGAGIEDRYDKWILLANLLLGARLPRKRWKEDSCFFLGPWGCVLTARHAICVNYLCKNITDEVEPDKIALLREREGKELELLFFICERLRKIIRKRGQQGRAGLTDSGRVL